MFALKSVHMGKYGFLGSWGQTYAKYIHENILNTRIVSKEDCNPQQQVQRPYLQATIQWTAEFENMLLCVQKYETEEAK